MSFTPQTRAVIEQAIEAWIKTTGVFWAQMMVAINLEGIIDSGYATSMLVTIRIEY